MKYKVLKKLYCPILGRRVEKGEEIEIAKENLESYRMYIEIKEEVKEEIEVVKIKEEVKKKK